MLYFYLHILNTRNWLFDDYQLMEKKLKTQYSNQIYNYWIKKEFNFSKHKKTIDKLRRFIDSNDYRLGYGHMDTDVLEYMKKIT